MRSRRGRKALKRFFCAHAGATAVIVPFVMEM